MSSQPAENPRQLGDVAIYCCPNRTFHTINTWSLHGYQCDGILLSGWLGISKCLVSSGANKIYFPSLHLAAFYFSSLRLHSCWPRPPLVNIDGRNTDGRKHPCSRPQSPTSTSKFSYAPSVAFSCYKLCTGGNSNTPGAGDSHWCYIHLIIKQQYGPHVK